MGREERGKGKKKAFFFPFDHLIVDHHQKDGRRKNLGDKTLHFKRVLMRGK